MYILINTVIVVYAIIQYIDKISIFDYYYFKFNYINVIIKSIIIEMIHIIRNNYYYLYYVMDYY